MLIIKQKESRCSLFLVGDRVTLAEEQGNAPHGRQADQGKDDAGEHGILTENRLHEVKIKDTDATPVEPADDGEDQRNSVKYHR